MPKSDEPKTKSAVTPIKVVRNYAHGLNRLERSVRTLLRQHGKDPDTVGLTYPLAEQYLRIGKEARELALFDVKVRKELAELQDIEFRVMNDEQLERLIQNFVRQRNYRTDHEFRVAIKQHLMELGADERAARTFSEQVCPVLPTTRDRYTPTAALNRSHKRVVSDLDDMMADVDEALDHHDRSTSSESHQDAPANDSNGQTEDTRTEDP